MFFSVSLLSLNPREEPLKGGKVLMMSQPPMFITPLAGSLTSSILQLCKYIGSLLQFCRPLHYISLLSEFEGQDYYQGIERKVDSYSITKTNE